MSSYSFLKRPIIGVILGTTVPITSGVEELVKANKKANTTLYFFSTRGVDFERSEIEGIWFNENKNRFERRVFPFPDVLYVRGGSGQSVRQVVEEFDVLGIPRINPIMAFNKSELYCKLSQDEDVRDFLPYTTDLNLEELGQLRSILRDKKTVYIKACRGRRGLQVMRVERLSSGKYEYSYSILGKLVRKKVNGFSNLQKAVQAFFGNREVIVQEAIDLLKVNGTCPVDFRAELQRDKDGKLTVVAIPARVGKSHSPITTHGSAYQLQDFLKKMYPNRSNEELQILRELIHEFLKTVYLSVESAYGRFGEIGIDFALDKNWNLWLIECNAQSAKVSIRRSYHSSRVHWIYRNPLEYAKTLVEE